MKIKEKHQEHLIFSAVELTDVNREIDFLDTSKAIQQNDILVNNKSEPWYFSEFITHNFNVGISPPRFSDILMFSKLNRG